mgnify:CR=1 FL=1
MRIECRLTTDTAAVSIFHMPRVARVRVPGAPHHVIQRGNNRQDVFFVNDDRRAYLDFLAEQLARYGLVVLSYCLMTNHVHLIAIPRGPTSLAMAIGRTHWLYSQYVTSGTFTYVVDRRRRPERVEQGPGNR